MNEKQFIESLEKNNLMLTDQQVEQFRLYYELLVEWNKNVNLTAITDRNEVYLKHFYDSVSPSFYYPFAEKQSICDIGAGAGFPSIPLKICFPHLQITIVDSLKKRIHFLEELVAALQLKNVQLIHSRAEDFGQKSNYRESFDIVTARAVARMSVLSEYCLPLCKVGGIFIALKGSTIEKELSDAKKAIDILGGKLMENNVFQLPIEKSDRSIVLIKKIKKTKKMYPRKAGIPGKNPIQ